MNNFVEILNKILSNHFVQSIIVIIISVIIYKIISQALVKSESKQAMKNAGQKDKTYIKLIRNFMKYAFFIIIVFTILQINGIDVSSMIAGVGVLSIIIGFVVQDAFKDIIRGIDIISDSYFSVGDIVKYNGIEGKVLVVGLKTTKIEDIRNSNVISIANRNIEQVEVVSNELYINIPMPYELTVDKAENAIKQIILAISLDERVQAYEYKGVNNLGDSSIEYLIKVDCNPREKLQVRRDILRIILVVLNKNKIEIPYQQIDIHNK